MIELNHPLLLNEFLRIGITPEHIESLPNDVKAALKNGIPSPVLITSLQSHDNTMVQIPARIQVVNDDAGKPTIKLYGVRTELHNIYDISPEDFNQIKKGNVLTVKTDTNTLYLQADPVTNNILSITSKELHLEEKMKSVEKILDIELGREQKQSILDGKPVTLEIGGEKSTIGVDIMSPNAFKMLKGDLNEWKRQQEINYDIAHPEFMGLVQTDENRWEYMMVQKHGLNAKELEQSTAQVRNSSMKR